MIKAIDLVAILFVTAFVLATCDDDGGGAEPEPPNGNGGPEGLPDTGQTKCYDQSNPNIEIPCDDTTCPGQDGFYATGCPNEGRFVDNGDGTVTDTCTGLKWQQDGADTNFDGVIDIGLFSSDMIPWCEALRFCENLNFAGHNDWRLPNVRELASIIDYSRIRPAIDPIFGALADPRENVPYCSSTTYAISPSVAWFVNFDVGRITGQLFKTADFYVRAVRGP